MRHSTTLLLVTLAGLALLAVTTGSAAATADATTPTVDAPADADAQWCYDLPCPCIVCVVTPETKVDPLALDADLAPDCIDPDCCPEDMPCEGVDARTVA